MIQNTERSDSLTAEPHPIMMLLAIITNSYTEM